MLKLGAVNHYYVSHCSEKRGTCCLQPYLGTVSNLNFVIAQKEIRKKAIGYSPRLSGKTLTGKRKSSLLPPYDFSSMFFMLRYYNSITNMSRCFLDNFLLKYGTHIAPQLQCAFPDRIYLKKLPFRNEETRKKLTILPTQLRIFARYSVFPLKSSILIRTGRFSATGRFWAACAASVSHNQ